MPDLEYAEECKPDVSLVSGVLDDFHKGENLPDDITKCNEGNCQLMSCISSPTCHLNNDNSVADNDRAVCNTADFTAADCHSSVSVGCRMPTLPTISARKRSNDSPRDDAATGESSQKQAKVCCYNSFRSSPERPSLETRRADGADVAVLANNGNTGNSDRLLSQLNSMDLSDNSLLLACADDKHHSPHVENGPAVMVARNNPDTDTRHKQSVVTADVPVEKESTDCIPGTVGALHNLHYSGLPLAQYKRTEGTPNGMFDKGCNPHLAVAESVQTTLTNEKVDNGLGLRSMMSSGAPLIPSPGITSNTTGCLRPAFIPAGCQLVPDLHMCNRFRTVRPTLVTPALPPFLQTSVATNQWPFASAGYNAISSANSHINIPSDANVACATTPRAAVKPRKKPARKAKQEQNANFMPAALNQGQINNLTNPGLVPGMIPRAPQVELNGLHRLHAESHCFGARPEMDAIHRRIFNPAAAARGVYPGPIYPSSTADGSHHVMPPGARPNVPVPGLPFPLPSVPPGYRLVITHQPLTDTTVANPQQVTQLIIDNPQNSLGSDVNTGSGTASSSQQQDETVGEVSGKVDEPATVKAVAVRPHTLNIPMPPHFKNSPSMTSNFNLPTVPKIEKDSQEYDRSPATENLQLPRRRHMIASNVAAGVFSPVRYDGDILDRTRIMAGVSSDEMAAVSSQSYPAAATVAAAAASVDCVIKTERTRSLPSTPNALYPLPIHKDFVSTSNVAEPDISLVSKPVVTSLNDGCWNKRASDKINNTFNVNNVVGGNNGGLTRCSTDPKHFVLMTPTSDVSTPSDDILQIADVDSQGVDKKQWSQYQSPTSSFDVMSTLNRRSHVSLIPKIDPDTSGFEFYLDASISTTRRIDEDRLTYLNKGQYYGLSLMYKPKLNNQTSFVNKSNIARSVVMVLFRERHSHEEEQKAWEFWHSRQHSSKQRVIDVDSKICGGAVPLSIEEIAYNAVAILWNKDDGIVKGSPLHLQIDTYENEVFSCLSHRAYAQIKVFCDKGADRKTREEERKIQKMTVQGDAREVRQKPEDKTLFYTMAEKTSVPLLFHPKSPIPKIAVPDSLPSNRIRNGSHHQCSPLALSPAHQVRRYSYDVPHHSQRVLMYVREEKDHAFTALLLEQPTLDCLLRAIHEKYGIDPNAIKHVFMKSKKCMVVRVDDNVVQHFANESTFIIRIEKLTSTTSSCSGRNETAGSSSSILAVDSSLTLSASFYDVTLVEIDVTQQTDS